MTHSPKMPAPLRRILLATDLSARCDRAMDRALQLANEWHAELIVLHVVEAAESAASDRPPSPSWRRREQPETIARREIEEDLRVATAPVSVQIGHGDVADTVVRVAAERQCDLIVTGLARSEALGRFSIGTTVEQLAQRAATPVLVVRNRPRAPYGHIVVTTDFSPASAQALTMAATLFPRHPLTLLHAYQTPFTGIAHDGPQLRRQYQQSVSTEAATFIAGANLPATTRQGLRVLTEEGSPEVLVHDYVTSHRADLVVLGTDERGMIMNLLIGSTTRTILEALGSLPCDALIVDKASARQP